MRLPSAGPPQRVCVGAHRCDGQRRRLAPPPRLHHQLRAAPRAPRHRARCPSPHVLLLRPRRVALPRLLPPHDLLPLRLHHLRFRRHQPRRRLGRFWQRVQGVPPQGLLHLAATEGEEHRELGDDLELPPGRQGSRESHSHERDT
jgi:hypothetical protein